MGDDTSACPVCKHRHSALEKALNWVVTLALSMGSLLIGLLTVIGISVAFLTMRGPGFPFIAAAIAAAGLTAMGVLVVVLWPKFIVAKRHQPNAEEDAADVGNHQ